MNSFRSYESNLPLRDFTKEALRLYASTLLFGRVAIQDFKLGEYSIAKGTYLNVPMNAFHQSELFYNNHRQLEIDRFSKLAEKSDSNKKPKHAEFMPFGLGKRNCMGRYLAELFIQNITVHFSKKFEIKHLEGHEIGAEHGVSYAPDSCFLRLKPRS